jgi:tRNA(adenine34) deaminase
MIPDPIDRQFMQRALELARAGEAAGEVPVGALLVHDGEVVAEAFNRPISAKDPSAHAEMLVLRDAATRFDAYRFPDDTTLYVTLEPCAMCAGAMVHARVGRLVFGAWDPKTGAAGSVHQLVDHPQLNHSISITSGVLEKECGALLRAFFRSRRLAP